MDYLGYITKDKRLAMVTPDGKTVFFNDAGHRLAFFGALSRDGRLTDEVQAIAEFNAQSIDTSAVAQGQPMTAPAQTVYAQPTYQYQQVQYQPVQSHRARFRRGH